MYKNGDGYSDPTAGMAISNVMREYRKKQREKYAVKNRPKIYVASRYAGDIEKNVADAARACRYVAKQKKIPVASHLMYPYMGFDDSNPAERELCCLFGLALIAVCDEVWCFKAEGIISKGMQGEIDEAKRLGIPVKFFDMEVI